VRVALGADHAGYRLKAAVAAHLTGAGHDVVDLGTDSEEMVDYPAFCARVGRAVARGEADVGVVLGGSGQGEAIAANKVRGVRAALCQSEYMARLARSHNHANVLALGARVLGEAYALAIVDVFLATGFDGDRHQRRVRQITEIEDEECGSQAGGRTPTASGGGAT
jgi:ribose 5-phosphate isomerase B